MAILTWIFHEYQIGGTPSGASIHLSSKHSANRLRMSETVSPILFAQVPSACQAALSGTQSGAGDRQLGLLSQREDTRQCSDDKSLPRAGQVEKQPLDGFAGTGPWGSSR
jgi:hypothetical protein